jgi:hypothetical protein
MSDSTSSIATAVPVKLNYIPVPQELGVQYTQVVPEPAKGVKLDDIVALFDTTDETVEVVVSDFEYLNGTLLVFENGTRGPRPGPEHWKEITQIGAVKYRGGEKIATFCEYVVPAVMGERGPAEMWSEFERITSISKATVMENGNSFEAVWERYLAFCGNAPIVVIMGDREVARWNFALIGKPRDAEIQAMNWRILKPLLPPKYQVLSGELYQFVGATPDEVCEGKTTHDGLFDASSMALFLSRYTEKIGSVANAAGDAPTAQ